MNKKIFITLLALITLAIGGFFIAQIATDIDLIWRVHEAETVISGRELYVDTFGNQSPHFIYLFTIPVYLASAFSLNMITTTKIFIAITVLLLLTLTYKILLRIPPREIPLKEGLILLLGLLLFISPARQLGQKSYIALAFYLPYIFESYRYLFADRKQPLGYIVIIGVLAGYGFAIKPHYLLIPVMIEILITLMKKKITIRPVFFMQSISYLMLYLISFITVPEYINVLLLIQETYLDYIPSAPLLQTLSMLILPMSYFFVVTAIHQSQDDEKSTLHYFILTITFAVTVIGIVQNKPFQHQYYPANVFSILGLFFIGYKKLKSSQFTTLTLSNLMAIILVTVPFTYLTYNNLSTARAYAQFHKSADYRNAVTYLNTQAGGQYVYVFTLTGSPIIQLMHDADLQFSSRYFSMWMIPGYVQQLLVVEEDDSVYISDSSDKNKRILHTIQEDLQKRPPRLILVDVREHQSIAGRKYDFIKYASQNKVFLEIFFQYEKLPEKLLNNFEIYKLKDRFYNKN